jgi:hypothetical protein
MKPIFDNRANLQGQPGLHVLIAGVSAYQNLPKQNEPLTPESFGMRQLSSTALTAYKVYRWLLDHQQNLPVPLATCRLLLSPSSDEVTAEPALDDLADRCTLDNFLVTAAGWRNDAGSHQENMTFFYFAGHGVQRTKDDSVLLMEDFDGRIGGLLRKAVDTNNIFKGMAKSNTHPNMALTQLYFIDACRDFLPAFKNFESENTTPVFRVQLSGEDKRTAPIFYAAAPGTKAIGIKGEQTLFSKALLDCLNGDAGVFQEVDGQEKWHVSVHSLNEALETKIDDWNATLQAEQDFILGGWVTNTPIYFLEQPPVVEIILEVVPPEALEFTRVQALALDDQAAPIPALPVPLDPHPYHCKWKAGFYSFGAVIEPPDPRFIDYPVRPRQIMPPRFSRKVKVIP